jgi:hypothetical protein
VSVLRDLLTPPSPPVTDPSIDPIGYERTQLHIALAKESCVFIPFAFKLAKVGLVLLLIGWVIALIATGVSLVQPHYFPDDAVAGLLLTDAALPSAIGMYFGGRTMLRRMGERNKSLDAADIAVQEKGTRAKSYRRHRGAAPTSAGGSRETGGR